VNPRRGQAIESEERQCHAPVLMPFDGIMALLRPRTSSKRRDGAIYVEAGGELTWELDIEGEVTAAR